MNTTSSIPPEKLAIYRRTARRRQAEEKQRVHERFRRAWHAAEAGAALLKAEYGASHVVVFGSLVDERLFHHHSDIDLAAWDIDPDEYLRALADLLSPAYEFSFDLVLVEEASPTLRATIEQDGVEL